LEIRFEEAIGLGLLCRSLSKSPNPWLDIIPDTRKISTHKKSIYLRERSRVILKWNITKWRIEAIRKRKEGSQKKSWNTKQKWRRRRRRPKWMHHISCISDTMIIPWKLLVEKFKKNIYFKSERGATEDSYSHISCACNNFLYRITANQLRIPAQELKSSQICQTQIVHTI
jgi:hypothetical protein